MNLRRKLLLACVTIAVVTLIGSAIGYWQARRLADALYEVGAVRLPGFLALDQIFEAKTALDASKRELLRSDELGRVVPELLAEERKRQAHAWARAEEGWRDYRALPLGADEVAQLRDVEAAWQAWRASYDQVMVLLESAVAAQNPELLRAAAAENQSRLFDTSREARERLQALIETNASLAARTRQASIESHRDTRRVRWIMLGAAAVSLLGAVGLGAFLSRTINRPLGRMSATFARIAAGEMTAPVPVQSRDEIGQLAIAMNHMVDSLRSSQSLFRAVFEASFDAIGVSSDGRMVLCNPALAKLFGYDSPAAAAGRSVLDFIAPADRAIVEDRRRNRAAGVEMSPVFELTGVRRDGSAFLMEVQAVPFVLHGVPHVVAVHRDVTELRRSAAELAEAAQRLGLALRVSGLGVWRRAAEGGPADWDERMYALFGFDPAAGPPSLAQLIETVVPEDRDRARQAWAASGQPGDRFELHCRILRRDGQVRHLEMHGVVVAGDSERGGAGVLGVAGDVTEIVAVAAESARLREHLLQSQRMESLGTLSASVAHDFNNLLTGINGFIELAGLSVAADAEVTELLTHARTGTRRAGELVRRILAFSRQSRSTQRLPLDLAAVVREAAPLIAGVLRPGVNLQCVLAPNLPAVLADAGQVQQALMNLCINGGHAIGPQGGAVTVDVRAWSGGEPGGAETPSGCPAGPQVRLAVSDTGVGMDAATRARIFEPFFTTKGQGQGTGLGLFIVREIMAAHEGGFDVVSAPGEGSTFALFFPVTQAEPAGAAGVVASAGRGTGQKVLVLMDESSVGQVVELALRRQGFGPEVCGSAFEAWARFDQASDDYQLVLVDRGVAGLDVGEFCQRLRSRRAELPLIVVADREGAAAAVPEGTIRLGKPFEISALLGCVDQALAR